MPLTVVSAISLIPSLYNWLSRESFSVCVILTNSTHNLEKTFSNPFSAMIYLKQYNQQGALFKEVKFESKPS